MEEDFEYQFKSPFNMVSIPFLIRNFIIGKFVSIIEGSLQAVVVVVVMAEYQNIMMKVVVVVVGRLLLMGRHHRLQSQIIHLGSFHPCSHIVFTTWVILRHPTTTTSGGDKRILRHSDTNHHHDLSVQ
jgi:hypothetical protein